MMAILVQNISQLNMTIQNITQLNQQNVNQLINEFNETMQTNIENYITLNDAMAKEQENISFLVKNFNQFNVTIQNITQLNQQNINHLRNEFNETMETEIGNCITSNDLKVKEQGNKSKNC